MPACYEFGPALYRQSLGKGAATNANIPASFRHAASMILDALR
jgi:hypothetical protein